MSVLCLGGVVAAPGQRGGGVSRSDENKSIILLPE